MKKIIKNVIERQKDQDIVLTSEKYNPLKYSELKYLINKIAGQLSSQGIANKDRAGKEMLEFEKEGDALPGWIARDKPSKGLGE